jgi:hypothetical protein
MGLPLVLGIASGVLGLAGSASQIIGGAKQKRAALKAAREFQRQELKNYAEGRQVSTLGATLAREEMARQTAAGIGALQAGGIRGVVGGIGALQEANTRGARQIGAELDIQQQQLDREVMAENQAIRQMQEQRDVQELNAIQAQMNAGEQMQQAGIGGIAQTALSIGSMAAGGVFGDIGKGAATTV